MNYPVKTFEKRPADQRDTVRDTVRATARPGSTLSDTRSSSNGRPWWIKPPHVRICLGTRSLA